MEKNQNHRSNANWPKALRGDLGTAEQQKAYQELSDYLFIVAHNYLQARRSSVRRLAKFDWPVLSALAEDCVQNLFLKILEDECHMLTKYSGRGRFVAWTAQSLQNLIASELRRTYWHRDGIMDEPAYLPAKPSNSPERIHHVNRLVDLLEATLSHMSERNRTIFLRYVIDGERAAEVARDLNMSANGVYTSAHRMKARVSETLAKEGFGATMIWL